jgi:hypothetical protein
MQNGEPSGSIGIDAEHDAIVLRYRTRRYGETEWQDIRQRVPITGPTAPWGDDVHGSFARFIRTDVTAVGALRSYTMQATYSHAAIATG